MQPTALQPAGLLSFAAGAGRLGLSAARLEILLRDENVDLPRPFKIGAKKRWFREIDINAYIERKAAEAQMRRVPA